MQAERRQAPRARKRSPVSRLLQTAIALHKTKSSLLMVFVAVAIVAALAGYWTGQRVAMRNLTLLIHDVQAELHFDNLLDDNRLLSDLHAGCVNVVVARLHHLNEKKMAILSGMKQKHLIARTTQESMNARIPGFTDTLGAYRGRHFDHWDEPDCVMQ